VKVLIWTDQAYEAIPGGHRTQISSTITGLREMGIEVDLAWTQDVALDGIDLVHSFGAQAAWVRRAREARIPVVLSPLYWSQRYLPGVDSPHSLAERVLTVARFSASTARRGMALTSWRVLQPQLEKLICIESADLLAPNSKSEARAIREELGTSTPAHIVPNCVDSRLFVLPESSSQARRSGVLYVGRIEPHKNQLALIRALAGTGISLKIVGPVHPHHTSYLNVCQKAADSNVEFVGEVAHSKLVELYQRTEVHAMPSWFETTGLSSLEASVCGAAVVSTDRGYVRDYFGADAHYADPASVTSIRAAVLRALEAGHSDALRERILGNFTLQHAARETLAAYEHAR
jgi:glycosyltransferase involved in cell wall biosynthesis